MYIFMIKMNQGQIEKPHGLWYIIEKGGTNVERQPLSINYKVSFLFVLN